MSIELQGVCPLCEETIVNGECACTPEELAAEVERQDRERMKLRCAKALLTLGIFPKSLANQDLWRGK